MIQSLIVTSDIHLFKDHENGLALVLCSLESQSINVKTIVLPPSPQY